MEGIFMFAPDGSVVPEDPYGGKYAYHKEPLMEVGREPTSVYSDRMYSWDSEKYNRCTKEVWGDNRQYFEQSNTKPADIERFLRLYNDNESVQLFAVIRYVNQSNGYPVWRFDYTIKRKEG